MGFIYRLISPNGKSYIGQTRTTLEKRFGDHKRKARALAKVEGEVKTLTESLDKAKSKAEIELLTKLLIRTKADLNNKYGSGCSALYRAIIKYNWAYFDAEVLYKTKEDEDLDFYEKACIILFDSLSPNGYNLEKGGHGGKEVSEETRRKLSLIEKDRELYVKHDESRNLPKSLVWRPGTIYYRLLFHQNCESREFSEKETLKGNRIDALKFMARINRKEIEKLPIPGYRVIYTNKNGEKKNKDFDLRGKNQDELLEMANKYLDELLLMDGEPDKALDYYERELMIRYGSWTPDLSPLYLKDEKRSLLKKTKTKKLVDRSTSARRREETIEVSRKHLTWREHRGRVGYCIKNHPNCKNREFMSHKLDEDSANENFRKKNKSENKRLKEENKRAATDFYDKIDREGIEKVEGGYKVVYKMKNGKKIVKKFDKREMIPNFVPIMTKKGNSERILDTTKKAEDCLLDMAIEYLNRLIADNEELDIAIAIFPMV